MAGCISERRSNAAAAAGLIALSALSFAATSPSKVTAVRYWSLGDVTRVAIEVTSEFRYKSDRLSNPERLFFDIQGAKPEMVSKGMHVIPVNDGILRQIRVAETQPGVTRVVLDLERHAEFTASQLSAPDRLMVELRVKDRPAPPATASISGGKRLAAPPARPVEPDLMTAPAKLEAAAKIEPAAGLEPKKFEPPPIAEPRKMESQPELLAPPSNALSARVSAPLPPAIPAPRPDIGREAQPARRNTNGERSLTRVLGLKLGRVVLDPGHGGHDVGTHGPSGLYEKDVVLDVAKRLGTLIEQRLGSEVVYTRSDDTYIPLEERTQIANDRKADLFLSIHANSSPYRAVAGVETYYLNFTTSRTALDVAARENAGSERSVFDLKDLIQKIALKDKIDESREFAARIDSALYGISARSNPAARNRGVKKAPFVVLIGASMPSVLAEIGFLTNSGDEALLRKAEHRQKIAEALYKGIAAYADTLSHFQVAARE